MKTPCEKCKKTCGISLNCPECSKPLPINTTCTGCHAIIPLSDEKACYFIDLIVDNGTKSKDAHISTSTGDKDIRLSVDYKVALEEAAKIHRRYFREKADWIQDARTIQAKGIKAMAAMGMADGEIQAFMALDPVPERTYYRLKGEE